MALYKRGTTWWMSYTVDGKQVRKSTGQKKKKGAEVIYADVIASIHKGTYVPDEQRRSIFEAPSFDVAVEAYLQHRMDEGKSERSYQRLRAWWARVFAKRRLDTISSVEIETRLRAFTEDRGWSNSTRNNALHELAGLFTYAKKRSWIKDHPTRGGLVARSQVDNARERWLTPVEIAAVKDHSPPWLQDLIDFAVATTRRLGEIASLTRRNIHLDVEGRVFLATEATKNKRRVNIPLPGALGELVKRKITESCDEDAPIFRGPRGGRLGRQYVGEVFRKAVVAAGLPYGRGRDEISFHTLRHSGASILANKGIPIEVIKKIGGWKDLSMVERYAHLGDPVLSGAIEMLYNSVTSGEELSQSITVPVVEEGSEDVRPPN